MAIVRGREIKEVKRELADIDIKLKGVTQEIEMYGEYIIDATDQIHEIRDEIDLSRKSQDNKKNELSELMTQYLQTKKQLEFMTGNEDQVKPWDQERTESSLSTFGGDSI